MLTRSRSDPSLFGSWASSRTTTNLGEVVGEVLFRLPLEEDAGRNRRPDVAYVSFDRWPADRPMPGRDNAWDVVPDLAVEVISPTDLAQETLQKVQRVLPGRCADSSGSSIPHERQVHVYEVTDADPRLDGRRHPGRRRQSCRASRCRWIGCLVRLSCPLRWASDRSASLQSQFEFSRAGLIIQ